jgi:rod shape-determining protein MreB and related proteins
MKLDFLSRLTPRVGIDLGSTRTRVWSAETGFTVDEATCLAVDERSGKVVAVGDEAATMHGRVTQSLQIYEPVKNGEVTDINLLQAYLKVMLQKVFPTTTFFRPLIMVSVPSHLSMAKRQILIEALYAVGGKEVFTITQPLAAAIGAGVPIADASGTFLFHLGGGGVETAVISLGSVVVSDHSSRGGQYLDQKLQLLVKRKAELLISQRTAEMLKIAVASLDEHSTRELLTSGQDVGQGSPKEEILTAQLLYPEVAKLAEHYESLLKRLLSQIPPELTVDAIDKGLLLTGGMAQLNGLVDFSVNRLGVPATVVDDPEKAVVRGLATALEHLEEFQTSLGYLS